MKKTLRLVAVMVLVAFSVGAAVEATEAGEEQAGGWLMGLQRHYWEFAPEVSRIKYEEPGLMKEEGMMYGIGLSYTHRAWVPSDVIAEQEEEMAAASGGMFRADMRFSVGELDYDGATWGGTPLQIDNVDNRMVELRGLLGGDSFDSGSLRTFYIGLGYRYLNDDSSFHAAGYERESNYLYMPIGFETTKLVENGWSFGLTAEFDLFLWGRQKSHLSDFDPALSDIENDQDRGYGLRGSLRFQKENFAIEPFIRYWHIDDSEVVMGFVEPENKSTEYGIKFVWRF